MYQAINWENRIANYNIVMQLLKDNDFRPLKQHTIGEHYYYWKWNPNFLIKADIYKIYWCGLYGNPDTAIKLTSHGSLDLIRTTLEDALKATPKLFKK